jgi:hypothetical protein
MLKRKIALSDRRTSGRGERNGRAVFCLDSIDGNGTRSAGARVQHERTSNRFRCENANPRSPWAIPTTSSSDESREKVTLALEFLAEKGNRRGTFGFD